MFAKVQDKSTTTSAPAPKRNRAGRFARVGLEGQFLLALVLLTASAVAATCYTWSWHARSRIDAITGAEAQRLAATLALACQPDLAAANAPRLKTLGEYLITSGNVLSVAFYDGRGRCVAASGSSEPLATANVQSLSRVEASAGSGGRYLYVTDPVMADASDLKLTGYITVAISPAAAELQTTRMSIFAIGIGAVTMLVSLPLAYSTVRRILKPLRKLEDATHQISAGDFTAHVNIQRDDAIGVLADAFNEMVDTIRRQRADLQQANAQLEEKVTERTCQLQAANKRLSNEIAEKEDFLRAVSHDLNAPLRNISGMATMLLMKHGATLDKEITHRLDRIQKNVEAETGLIAELLELSRIKTRRQKMEMVEIGALVRELEGMLENDLKSKHIALKIDTPLPVLSCERARLRQVFQNLIDNAIKYMGDGAVREIRIGCTLRGSEAEFYVSDTGMGIDPEDLDKVFFVFRRGKNAAGASIAGKGVGLASVKSIIETYNGSIWVQSQRGQGSTFTFTVNGQYVPQMQSITRPIEQKSESEMTDDEFAEAGTALQEQLEV